MDIDSITKVARQHLEDIWKEHQNGGAPRWTPSERYRSGLVGIRRGRSGRPALGRTPLEEGFARQDACFSV